MVQPNQLAAGGGGVPLQAGGAPQDQARVAPGAPPQGGPDPEAVKQALVAALQQSVDEEGFVDMGSLVQIWPQVAQQVGIDIPFEAILAMIDANPEILESLIQELGLSGMIIDGQRVTGPMLEEALQASGGGGGGAPIATGVGAVQGASQGAAQAAGASMNPVGGV